MSKINVEISSDYREKMDLLKKIIPNKEGKEIESDSEILEVLVDEFVGFIQMQANQQQGGCCGGGEHNHEGHSHDHGKGGCGCSH